MTSAREFSEQWIAAWNARDLEAVLSHYAGDAVFLSPLAQRRLGDGRVVGVDSLRAYWAAGLAAVPDLKFTLESVLEGHRCLTIVYRNQLGTLVAETMEFDDAGQVARSFACYG